MKRRRKAAEPMQAVAEPIQEPPVEAAPKGSRQDCLAAVRTLLAPLEADFTQADLHWAIEGFAHDMSRRMLHAHQAKSYPEHRGGRLPAQAESELKYHGHELWKHLGDKPEDKGAKK